MSPISDFFSRSSDGNDVLLISFASADINSSLSYIPKFSVSPLTTSSQYIFYSTRYLPKSGPCTIIMYVWTIEYLLTRTKELCAEDEFWKLKLRTETSEGEEKAGSNDGL